MFIFSLHLSEKEFHFLLQMSGEIALAPPFSFTLFSALNKLKRGVVMMGKTSKNFNVHDDEADLKAL